MASSIAGSPRANAPAASSVTGGPRHLPIIVLLVAALGIGLLTVSDYGESWDEADIRRYSAYAVDAYRYLFRPADLLPFETNLNLYGPAYFIAASMAASALHILTPQISVVASWHAVHFITFLVGTLGLYLLALRWMRPLPAFGVALLWLSQPLLWGHAFINPKDTPFATFFIAAVFFGLRMVDGLHERAGVWHRLAVAAVLLGVCSSLRVLGPLAALMVIGYALYAARDRAVVPLLAYVSLAGLTAYLCWPYLWPAPLSRFLVSLNTMADFPFESTILFGGQLYTSERLPLAFFPTLLLIQLTESALLFVGAGLLLAVPVVFSGKNRAVLLLFLGWFAIPLLVILVRGSPIYDNGRQLLFLLPPLFLAAGLAFERLFERFRRPMVQWAVLLGAAAPGILLGIRMHPYEYVYYNVLAGGTGGAFRSYEMDYWGTSFDEITRHLNTTAPTGARVVVHGPTQIVAAGARADLDIRSPREGVDTGYDFAVLLTRANWDQRTCRAGRTLYAVERRGAVFAELRGIPPGSRCE